MNWARGIRVCAALLALHGVLLAACAGVQRLWPTLFEGTGEWFFWVTAVPALVLASPFTWLFWKLGLMNAPGWFAWPKPSGLALAYAAWITLLVVIAQLIQRGSRKH